MPRTATTKTPAKTSTTSSRTKKSTSSKTVAPVEEKVTTARTRAKAKALHPATTEKKTAKKIPENRVVATDNPNLLNAEKDGSKKISGMTYAAISEKLGFGVGTEQFLVALELLKGGETRSEINDRMKELLPATTVHGTPKQVTNLVSGVHGRMLAKGFKVQGSYKLVLVKGAASK
jgi:predicted extracellular nuclease